MKTFQELEKQPLDLKDLQELHGNLLICVVSTDWLEYMNHMNGEGDYNWNSDRQQGPTEDELHVSSV